MLHITNKVWTHWKGLDAPYNKQINYGLTGKDLMLHITNKQSMDSLEKT